ncbi:MAG TPA: response regulator [Kofleriaceae bacterium]|nr:response regulator [Kofleriaceae bacterium]
MLVPQDDKNAPLSVEGELVEVVQTGDILVVDDNPSNLLAIEAALSDIAGQLVKVSSGADALRALLERPFALVLLDVQMPNMDGFEAARLIRSRGRTQHIPIIFITAFGRDEAQVLRGYELGAVDFLFKPIVPEVLRAKASVFVALQRHTAEVARQAELLRRHERREHERRLTEERRRWEGALLRRKVAELADADRRKDEFLAILGHELRNPIAPIINGLAVLAASDDPEVITRARKAMDRQARHLARLVDDLLDVSRITSGKIELRRELVPISAIIDAAIAMSRPLIDEKGHHLAIDVADPALAVLGDAVRLTQVVSNLLNNAARYTPSGGRIEIECAQEGERVAIRVSDNGQGIAPGLIGSVFDMFVRASPEGSGLGIGLTLAARLVEMHGGAISVQSDGVGKGCVFSVKLPVAQADELAAKPRKATAPVAASGRGNLRIAVVEDNADIRETLRDLLEVWGHHVQTASDGRAGAELVIRERPQVALVDIGMPELDGYEVAARVRHALGSNAVRLVAMTGFGHQEARDRALEAGFDTHIVKPVDTKSLRQMLQDIQTGASADD